MVYKCPNVDVTHEPMYRNHSNHLHMTKRTRTENTETVLHNGRIRCKAFRRILFLEIDVNRLAYSNICCETISIYL